ncbi:MAG: DUF3108 domain-containing protein [Deltaproteobacteria bacterium]|nr:DUF3108 domain-containing protein [Deltaproteobacteria bacterium]
MNGPILKIFAGGLILGLLGLSILPASLAASPAETLLEDLRYEVDVWVWRKAVQARISLRKVGEGRYLAEISGEALGLARVLSGQRRDNHQTEMVYRNGRLAPVVYREESRRRGRRHFKEYRFLYDQGRLELWQWDDHQQQLFRKWETPLQEPMYDPISAFYNYRLGLMGPVKAGDILRVQGIPHPQREIIEVRLGPEGEEGKEAMVSLVNRAFEDEKGVVFVTFDKDLVPTRAWSRVLVFGKIIGRLQSGSKSVKPPLDLAAFDDY